MEVYQLVSTVYGPSQYVLYDPKQTLTLDTAELFCLLVSSALVCLNQCLAAPSEH